MPMAKSPDPLVFQSLKAPACRQGLHLVGLFKKKYRNILKQPSKGNTIWILQNNTWQFRKKQQYTTVLTLLEYFQPFPSMSSFPRNIGPGKIDIWLCRVKKRQLKRSQIQTNDFRLVKKWPFPCPSQEFRHKSRKLVNGHFLILSRIQASIHIYIYTYVRIIYDRVIPMILLFKVGSWCFPLAIGGFNPSWESFLSSAGPQITICKVPQTCKHCSIVESFRWAATKHTRAQIYIYIHIHTYANI